MIRVLLATVLLLATLGASAPKAPKPGSRRWDVKTGVDLAAKPDLSSPIPATVKEMVAWQAPAVRPKDQRIQPVETTLWTVEATMIGYRHAEDGDFHLVLYDIEDGVGRSMVAEIPDPTFVARRSPIRREIAAARRAFIRAGFSPVLGRFKACSVRVRVTGLGFYDSRHGQEGLAPNGIEVHPVVRFDVIR